jgi:Fe-S-cluster containining protein
MADMAKIRARAADPTLFTEADERVRQIQARLRASPVNMMAQALQAAPEPARKVFWLREITKVLDIAMRGIAPCKEGCDACCHMATGITLQEAQAIAATTGRAMTVPPDLVGMQAIELDRIKYNGVPCVFLEDHRCSIYEHRPYPCRVHFSVDRDNLLCQIVPGEAIRMPSYDNSRFNVLALLANGDPRGYLMADIRDFFVPQPKHGRE